MQTLLTCLNFCFSRYNACSTSFIKFFGLWEKYNATTGEISQVIVSVKQSYSILNELYLSLYHEHNTNFAS